MTELVLATQSIFSKALSLHAVTQIDASNLKPSHERLGGFQKIESDLAAIELWLHNQYRDREKTRRAYSKEVLRFLLWASLSRQKTFSDLDEHDIEAYFRFILNPEPQELWRQSSSSYRPKKDSPDWKPFAGPIKTVSSYNQAQAAIATCFAYLFDVQYLKCDPFRMIRLPKFNVSQSQRKIDVAQRILSADEWNVFVETLLNLPETNYQERAHKARLRFIVTTLYFLGLRCEELANLQWHDFVKINDYWLVRVAGKGRASEVESDTVLCSTHYLKEVSLYRDFLRYGELSANIEDESVLFSLTSGRPLTAANIRRLIKEHARLVARSFDKDSASFQKMQLLSPHWLRHLCASKLSQNAVNVSHIKEHLRHRNAETTYLYIHSDFEERLEEINKVKLVSLSD